MNNGIIENYEAYTQHAQTVSNNYADMQNTIKEGWKMQGIALAIMVNGVLVYVVAKKAAAAKRKRARLNTKRKTLKVRYDY